MITLQHAGLFIKAMAEKYPRSWMSEMNFTLPWVLAPDALRMYVGARQAGHHEIAADGTDTSWMVYPTQEQMRTMTKVNGKDIIKHYIVADIRPCAIGEETDIEKFDQKNWDHPMYHFLRIHLAQDIALDKTLRSIVDCNGRYQDTFVVNHNKSIKLKGPELRDEIANFEQVGFLRLAGAIYKKTGIAVNQSWFDKHVKTVLLQYYPEDLAENTYKYMRIREDLNERINNLDFEITEEDKATICITNNLEDVLNSMYSIAHHWTIREIA